MVVQLGQPWLEDGVLLLMRVSLRGSHSSSHSQQSRLRRESRPRRQSRHLSHNFAALVVPVLQSHRGQRHSGGVHVRLLDHRVCL